METDFRGQIKRGTEPAGPEFGIELALQNRSAVRRRQEPVRELPDPASLLAPPGAWFVVHVGGGTEIHPFPELSSVCPGTRAEAEAMVARLATRKSGADRVTFALGLQNGEPAPCAPNPDAARESRRTSVTALARAWGIDAAVSDPDPRAWDPVEIAALVRAARGAATRDAPDTPPGSILARLAPLGFQRACSLVYSENASECQDLSHRKRSEHFPFETVLYRLEWEISHPEPSGSGSETAAWKAAVSEYEAVRWTTTDDSAPHLDLDLLRQAQMELESKEKGLK